MKVRGTTNLYGYTITWCTRVLYESPSKGSSSGRLSELSENEAW